MSRVLHIYEAIQRALRELTRCTERDGEQHEKHSSEPGLRAERGRAGRARAVARRARRHRVAGRAHAARDLCEQRLLLVLGVHLREQALVARDRALVLRVHAPLDHARAAREVGGAVRDAEARATAVAELDALALVAVLVDVVVAGKRDFDFVARHERREQARLDSGRRHVLVLLAVSRARLGRRVVVLAQRDVEKHDRRVRTRARRVLLRGHGQTAVVLDLVVLDPVVLGRHVRVRRRVQVRPRVEKVHLQHGCASIAPRAARGRLDGEQVVADAVDGRRAALRVRVVLLQHELHDFLAREAVLVVVVAQDHGVRDAAGLDALRERVHGTLVVGDVERLHVVAREDDEVGRLGVQQHVHELGRERLGARRVLGRERRRRVQARERRVAREVQVSELQDLVRERGAVARGLGDERRLGRALREWRLLRRERRESEAEKEYGAAWHGGRRTNLSSGVGLARSAMKAAGGRAAWASARLS